jgi:hypothetical protein
MNWLAQAVGGMTDDSARRQNILTLGELRDALKALPAETPVVMADGNAPAELSSYRGYYERLAIETNRHCDDYETKVSRYAAHPDYDPEPAVAGVTIAEPVTAAEMVKALDLADGEAFGGYKGGHYEMHSGTWMHAAEYGDVGLAVYGVRVTDGKAVIETGEYEW